MINKFKSAVLAGSAVLAVSLGATAANAATTQGDATANIVAAITVSQTNGGLNFGTIVPHATNADTVVIDFLGGATCGTDLTCSGTTTAAAFTATGTANQSVSIVTDAATSISNGAVTMNVNGIAPSAANAVLSALGQTSFTVGGTLNVGAAQQAGVYSGQFDVTVNYN